MPSDAKQIAKGIAKRITKGIINGTPSDAKGITRGIAKRFAKVIIKGIAKRTPRDAKRIPNAPLDQDFVTGVLGRVEGCKAVPGE